MFLSHKTARWPCFYFTLFLFFEHVEIKTKGFRKTADPTGTIINGPCFQGNFHDHVVFAISLSCGMEVIAISELVWCESEVWVRVGLKGEMFLFWKPWVENI